MKKSALTAVAFFAMACSLFAASDTYYWGSYGGSLNGYFNDPHHWFKDAKGTQAANLVPNVNAYACLYPAALNNLTITFPDGVTTNYARFWAQVRTNSTLVVESKGSLVHPRGDGVNTYYNSYNPFQILWTYDNSDRGMDLLGYINNCAATNGVGTGSDYNAYKVQPNLEFRDFRIVASSPTVRDVKVVLERGWFDFLTPCGEQWANSWQFPNVYFGHFNANYGSSTVCMLDTTEFVVESNATLRTPVLSIQGNGRQNKVYFHGGDHVIPALLMPSRLNGHDIYEGRTVTDLVLDQGARIDCTNCFTMCGFKQSSNRVERLTVSDGSWLRISSLNNPNYGEQEYNVDNATLALGVNARASQTLMAETVKSVTFNLRNNANLVLDHKGQAAGANGTGLFFGNRNDIGEQKYFFNCDRSTITMFPSSQFNLYGGKYTFTDSTVEVPKSTTFQLIGGRGAAPGIAVVDHSVIANTNTTYIAIDAEMRVTLKNQSKLYTSDLVIGGNAVNGNNGGKEGTAAAPVNGELNVYDSEICQKDGGVGGTCQIGTAHGVAKGVLNLYSGFLDFSSERAGLLPKTNGGHIYAGRYGYGELNVYGGTVKAFGIHAADSAWAANYDQSGEEASVIRVNGGRVVATSYGNGRFVGGVSAGGGPGSPSKPGSRKGRLILNGGVVEAYQVYGGAASRSRGGTGWSVLEADGGTVKPVAHTHSPYLVEFFDDVQLGSKGLTIDNDGLGLNDAGDYPANPIQVRQAFWADKPGEAGRLVLSGHGATAITGNVERVSNFVVAQGYGDLSHLDNDNPAPVMHHLIVTNSATIMLNPARTITLNGGATFGDFSIHFTSAVAKDKSYTLFKSAEPLSADSLRGWSNAFVVNGRPDSCGCDFTQVEESGWYLLKMTVREASDLEIVWPHGVSNGTANVTYGVSDMLRVTVGGNDDYAARLTLSGKLQQGGIKKLGVGTLYLTNPNNYFAPGIFLYGGCLSVSDFRTLNYGHFNKSTFETRLATLEITGPATGASYDRQIHMIPQNTNEFFMIKNEVDVTMPCPYAGGTTGSFLKRGKGRLTLEVEGDTKTTLCGGYGYGKLSNNTITWYQGYVIQAQFRENGLPSTSGITPFEIYEGELVFRGKGPNAVVKENGECVIGHSTKVGTAQPGLVLDNVTFDASQWPHAWVLVGCGVNYSNKWDVANARSGDFATAPYLVVTNGATLVTRQLEVARYCDGETAPFEANVLVDDATLKILNYFTVNRSSTGTAKSRHTYRNSANVYVNGSVFLDNDTTLEFDHSTLAKDETLAPTKMRPEDAATTDATATFVFRNGSVCALGEINPGKLDPVKAHPITLTFDDSEWRPATNLTDDVTIGWENPDQVSIQTENAGLKMAVPAGRTWNVNQPIVGSGDFTKFGPGMLLFGPGAMAYEGVTHLRDGVLSLEFAGNAYAMTVAGTGTLYRATLGMLSILENYVNGKNRVEECPHFVNLIATSGYVDFGRNSLRPLPIREVVDLVVGTYEGEAPDVSRWRVRNTGVENARGTFACEDGKILLKEIQDGYGTLIITR